MIIQRLYGNAWKNKDFGGLIGMTLFLLPFVCLPIGIILHQLRILK